MMIKIVRGNPTPEELAAALAVVRARALGAAPGTEAPGPAASEWAAPARLVRAPLPPPSPGAWSHASWPR
ncbi:acyl-CoA carboxylase epsilon subunit [Streptomyces sp. NPDC020875]|uniref:acyl-CoA carboxylase epsilon subunit n=1 Tax=Streptomyces sp. NPDC020875 TaxID=3154898 RepID=UPI0033D0B397